MSGCGTWGELQFLLLWNGQIPKLFYCYNLEFLLQSLYLGSPKDAKHSTVLLPGVALVWTNVPSTTSKTGSGIKPDPIHTISSSPAGLRLEAGSRQSQPLLEDRTMSQPLSWHHNSLGTRGAGLA